MDKETIIAQILNRYSLLKAVDWQADIGQSPTLNAPKSNDYFLNIFENFFITGEHLRSLPENVYFDLINVLENLSGSFSMELLLEKIILKLKDIKKNK